jgi:hypothetical protein
LPPQKNQNPKTEISNPQFNLIFEARRAPGEPCCDRVAHLSRISGSGVRLSYARRGLCGTNSSKYDAEQNTHNANTPGTAVLFDDLDFEDCFLPRTNLQIHRQMQRADTERRISNITGKSERQIGPVVLRRLSRTYSMTFCFDRTSE